MTIIRRILVSIPSAAHLAFAAICLALSLPAIAAQDTVTDNADVVYKVNRHDTLLLPASQVVTGTWPYTPSQCVALFGLACYTPALMRSAYDIPADADGSGQTIVIVDAYGSPTVKEDLDIFSTTFRLPPADLEVVYPPGHLAQLPPSGFLSDLVRSWAGETSLDVQWAHAIAPKAKIVLVVSATEFGNDLNVAQRYAIDNHLGQVMSLSFGVFEAGLAGGPNQSHWFLHLKQAHANYEAALAAGISVISISHDYGTGIYGEPSATYPGSDPLVTAVGGTSLFMTDAGQYLGETVWNDFDDCPLGCKNGPIPLATGGAPSILFNAPLYQAPFSGFGTRTTSDVSYNAGCYTGILYYLGFLGPYSGWYIACGTSEGAPQWAAITALVNQSLGAPVGFFNPQIYAIGADPVKYAEVFHDVTVGDNALFGTPFFHANSGYDLPTGLGSPDVDALLKALKSQ